MDLFDTIGGWIDTGVDWVAETIGGYESIQEFGEEVTAGQQLIGDIKSFTDSDTFGFIRKGAEAYAGVAGLGEKGKESTNYFVPPTSKRRKSPRSVGTLAGTSRGMSTSPITASPVNIGYNNPDVRTALTSLLNNSYNQQMNNMFAQYIVTPTVRSGQKTVGIGSTTVKGISKKSGSTGRKTRGLA
jgi:hypothetical protein